MSLLTSGGGNLSRVKRDEPLQRVVDNHRYEVAASITNAVVIRFGD